MSTPVNERIGARVKALRAERDFSLDMLAARSAVSRSAISLIERGETSPTAVVLERLAAALGVSLASLFDEVAPAVAPSPVARRREQTPWRDPASGYVRRNVSPPAWPSPIRLVEVEFPAGASVAYEQVERDVVVHQQVWLLAGAMDVAVGDDRHHLEAGDCLAMRVDRPTSFHNPGDRKARYAVVLVEEPAPVSRRAS